MIMNVLAIIPARGGSKGVKDKNIREVDGMPLIAYSIQCAQESKLLNKVIVSTDSQKIADIAGQYGAEVQMRPEDLAQDDSSIVSVIQYVLDKCQRDNYHTDLVVLLQPTSPIRRAQDVDSVITLFADESIDGVISVVRMDDVHPARMYTLTEELRMVPFMKDHEYTRRQDLQPVYYRNGCIYAVRTSAFGKYNSVMVDNKKAYVMPFQWLLNIDHERDMILADSLVKLWKAGKL